jgi:hypothetical protein
MTLLKSFRERLKSFDAQAEKKVHGKAVFLNCTIQVVGGEMEVEGEGKGDSRFT